MTQCASGYQPPSKTPPPSFLLSPPEICKLSQPPFLGNPPIILVFHELPLKVEFLSEHPEYQSFSSLNPSYLLKGTKFLVKICQFEFFVMTEKNIFVYKVFLSVNTSDFSFLYFFCKIATPLKKVTPLF